MGLDIRWPIGLLFSIFGVLLIGYGAFCDPAVYQKSLGINVNVAWGGFLLLFGVLMAGLAKRAKH